MRTAGSTIRRHPWLARHPWLTVIAFVLGVVAAAVVVPTSAAACDTSVVIRKVETGAGEHIVSCTDALALLARKRDTVTALIKEATDRKRRIEALMAELQASRKLAPGA